ncbi:MAG: ElyC/SanA/YdcF family protein [Crocinitomicaceae bacterium]|nr:ElyC/SanA/YdcF family protein [Crocinitomicaceae bacterium]
MRSLLKLFLVSSELIVLLFIWANFRVLAVSSGYVSDDINAMPKVKVGIVPGTIRYLASGNPNLYFSYRINAAVKLYRSRKVSHLLISGDNGRKGYNEPLDMKNALMEQGIPESDITLDYAGFDTYDSMIRAKEVFGQEKYVVISQEFQNERAVYIARRFGIEAYGFNAQDVKQYGGLRTKVRETLARVKAFVEVQLGVKPTFLGEKVLID